MTWTWQSSPPGNPAPARHCGFARGLSGRLSEEPATGFGLMQKFSTPPRSLQYEVIRSGRLVYARDRGARIRYEAGVLSLYLDYAETLDWFDRVLLTKG